MCSGLLGLESGGSSVQRAQLRGGDVRRDSGQGGGGTYRESGQEPLGVCAYFHSLRFVNDAGQVKTQTKLNGLG